MTKKDYELIAKLLNSLKDDMNNGTIWVEYCELWSNTLASKNPRFDKEKFLQACGIDSN